MMQKSDEIGTESSAPLNITSQQTDRKISGSRPRSDRMLLRWIKSQSPLLFVGYVIIFVVLLATLALPWLLPADFGRVNPSEAFQPVFSGKHLLGTDQLGRDLLYRIALGLRNSLLISFTAVILAIIIGVLIGLLAGYHGGLLETLLMRLTDVQMALPFIVLAVVILSVAEPSYISLAIVLCLAVWPAYARSVRSHTQLEKSANHIDGVRALGAGSSRILRKFLLPAALAPVSVLAILDMATLIMFEATLGFLGIGSPPDSPSLGSIMADGKQFITSAWWISVLPGVVIFVTILGINLIGTGLREKRG